MAELKKCPFCGGEARIYISGKSNGYRVACKKILACGAKLEWFDKEEDAIEAWNNRATEAELRANVIDEFAEKLKSDYHKHGIVNMLKHGEDYSRYGREKSLDEYIDEIAEQMKGEQT